MLFISCPSPDGRAKLPFINRVPSDHFLRNFIIRNLKITLNKRGEERTRINQDQESLAAAVENNLPVLQREAAEASRVRGKESA